MKPSDAARSERQELCDLFLAVGPDAPTLCGEWTTRDLAAHLIVREGRPDAALGILGGPLSNYTHKVQTTVSERDWTELVASVRTGPPVLSLFRIPGMEGLANLFEYAIHHEDVRRAIDGWQPRELPAGEQDLVWGRLKKGAKLFARKSPVGIVLQRAGSGELIVAKAASPSVTLVGEPLELLMRLYGRKEVIVEVQGDESAVASFESARFGV